jgi:hypothetical protein
MILPDELTGATFRSPIWARWVLKVLRGIESAGSRHFRRVRYSAQPVMNGDDVRFVPHLGLS